MISMSLLLGVSLLAATDIEERVEHGTADSGGVKIHYAALAKKRGFQVRRKP